MPVAKVNSFSSLDLMKSVGKPGEGNDSLDNFIRQAIGKEPVNSFSRAGDSPVQWIQLLHALDQQDLPGWPLLSPPKVKMQKCDKCNREFCSPINYRRHIRVHRRSLNIDKDFPKNRDFLGAYWNKLSLDEAKEIVSFNNVKLEEVPGSSVVKALTSFIRKPGLSSLPQVYIKAGAALLDVVQTKPSRFPITSQELFSILDDASERTFLCAGTALSLQKFVFDGEAGKIGLEMRNLVACTSFLVEQKLVEAWLADKDAEALRCQKLLVAEEEAAQKRQAELLERKRLKKLRQKEQKAKEHMDGDDPDFKEGSPDSLDGETSATSSMLPALDSHSHTQKSPSDPAQQSLEPVKLGNEVDSSCDSEFDDVHIDMVSGIANSINYQNVDNQPQQGSSHWQRPVSSPCRGAPNGFHLVQIHQFSKLGPVQKHGIHRGQRATTIVKGHKVWTRKTKPDNVGEDLNGRVQRELRGQLDENDSEVLIGSISVMLGDCNGCSQGDIMCGLTHQFAAEGQSELKRSKNAQLPVKTDSLQSGINRTRMKHWRPVGKQEAGSLAQNNQRDANVDRDRSKPAEQSVRNEISVPCSTINDCSSVNRTNSSIELEEVTDSRGPRLFCSLEAEDFLTQRWKEAIASEHVKLVLSTEVDPPDCFETQDGCHPSILCSADNRLSNLEQLEHATWGATKAKSRAKSEKGGRLKYIPKQRNNT